MRCFSKFFIFVDVVHLFPALCPTIEVRHPRTSRSVEHLVIFGATIFPVAKLFDNSSVGRFLILSNLEASSKPDQTVKTRGSDGEKTSGLLQKPGFFTKPTFNRYQLGY